MSKDVFHKGMLSDSKELLGVAVDGNSFWAGLGQIWAALAHELDPTSTLSEGELGSRVRLAVALGKLERNLVAGLEEHQQEAM